jgi:hypothetical protein
LGVHPIVRRANDSFLEYLMSDVVLEIKNLTRRFGAFTAVDALYASDRPHGELGLKGVFPSRRN